MSININYSPVHEELLRACLRQGDQGIEAFHRWRALFDFETYHDEAQHRLFPLLFKNMSACGLEDKTMPKLKAIHRLSWGKGQRRNKVAAETIGALQAAGISVMVTKGMALGQGYYGDVGQRPMADIDLVISPDDVVKALDILQADGWQFNVGRMQTSERAQRSYIIRTKTVELEKPDCPSIDLHWQPFHECDRRTTNDRFWEDAEKIEIDNIHALRPSPTYMLWHTVTHGLRPNVFSPIRWVADAAVIVQNKGDLIDWDRFSEFSKETHVSQRVHGGLKYLQTLAPLEMDLPATPRAGLIEHFEQRAFNDIHSSGDYQIRSVFRKLLIPRILRFAKSDKAKHLPFLMSDIVTRKLLHRG